ncbi:MAG: hypothetical protein ACUVQC_02365 [Thermaceae bacterium]
MGVAGYAFFLFLRPNPEGMALALGSASIAYGEKPFPVAFLPSSSARGTPFPWGGLGLGLPYLVYLRLRPKR